MSEISEKIIKDYRKNITIRDVQFYKGSLWDYLTVKITDKNKKHFRNKTLSERIYYNEKENLKRYVEWVIRDYITERKGKQIRDLESYQIIQECKKDLLEEKGDKMCEYCKTQVYFKTRKIMKSLLAPATHIEELRQKLEDESGEMYIKVSNLYCPICGRKLKEE